MFHQTVYLSQYCIAKTDYIGFVTLYQTVDLTQKRIADTDYVGIKLIALFPFFVARRVLGVSCQPWACYSKTDAGGLKYLSC